VPNDIGFGEFPGGFTLDVSPYPGRPEEFTWTAWFSYSGDSVNIVMQTADYQLYHVVKPGEVYHPAIHGNSLGEVGTGDFYLGVWVPGVLHQNYGWVHLRPVNGVITMVDSVMSYRSHGIVVGTTIVVPEPCSLMLVGALAYILLLTGRIRRPN
jgi:hypothetical protein